MQKGCVIPVDSNTLAQQSEKSDKKLRESALWERLQSLFSRRVPEESDDAIPHRRGLAITTSILVSSLLWFTFTMRETHMRIVDLYTEVVNIPENEALSQLPPETVRVQVVGDGWSLLRLRLNPPPIPVDASHSEVQIINAVPELPGNVQVQGVSPNVLNLWKERRITRYVPVRPQFQITTPPTHDLLAEPRITPESLQVTGATSVVGELDYWPTLEWSFEDVRDSLDVRVPLSDTLRGLVEKDVESVAVFAVAREFTEGSREIEVEVQGQPSTQRLVSLEPSTIRVRYRVPLSQYQDAQRAMDFYATVSFDEIRTDTTGLIEPQLSLPDDMVLRDVEMIPRRLQYYERID